MGRIAALQNNTLQRTTLPIALRSRLVGASALAAAVAAAWPAHAQTGPAEQTIVVTGSLKGQRTLDAPYAITAVDAGELRDAGPLINLSEGLARVPGLVVANRNNYAQDLQIGSRGFGARATFGVRGIRLYTDGIPASMPDGQGQVGHFDLAGAARVEVLRGPFSVLYGNSSGGVIALFTAPVTEVRSELAADAGRFGLRQLRGSIAAPLGGGFDLRAGLAAMEIDGFRPQSAADRRLANVRLGWQGTSDSVVLLGNDHHQTADDPLGLTPEQFAEDARQTTAQAEAFDTRKTIRQTQAGVNWRHSFDGSTPLRESSLTAYGGTRSVTQFLAIPALTQRNPAQNPPTWQRHGGGVVDFDRRYDGFDARLRFGWDGVDVQAGVAIERQKDDRRGFENFTGDPTAPDALGVFGDRRRDETNRATTRDGYLQAEFAVNPALAVTAGVRSGRVDVKVDDHYASGLNGDDSGSLRFDYTNPVVGVRLKATPLWTLHFSAARGFESPTLGELAYTADNSGFNFALKGQTSRQFELGSKWRGEGVELDAALFLIDTDDEIGVRSSLGGRSSFQNVGRTRRYGAELAGAWQLTPQLRARAALSVLHARYVDGFDTCPGAPCPTPANPLVHVDAGTRIAGTQSALAWAELAWKPPALPGEVAVELRGQSRTAANDVNRDLGQDFAPGHGIVNLRWSNTWPLGADSGELQTLLRVDNALDKTYVGSVIVNDANSRFFEPGAPRAWLASLRWVKRW
jgi:iron complex outermembrane receptor protein